MVNIYAFIGVIGSGKNYRAEKLQGELLDSIMINFSDGVRDSSWSLLNWKPKNVKEYEVFKSTFFINEYLGVSISGRMILQRIGTDIMRAYDPDVWANIWYRKVLRQSEASNIIVSDLRYINEARRIMDISSMGGNVKIIFTNYKSNRYEISAHESEALAIELLNEGFNDGDDVTEFLLNKLKNEDTGLA